MALPTTRVAVMGPAGVEYVYKDELKKYVRIAGRCSKRSQHVAIRVYPRRKRVRMQPRCGRHHQGRGLLAQRYEIMNPRRP